MATGESLGKTVVREPAAESPAEYGRRVYALAFIYISLFVTSIIGMSILVWRGRFFVTLSQRSNVETLLLAFFFIFFAYIGLISRSGAMGALRIAWYTLAGLFVRDGLRLERMKEGALNRSQGSSIEVALSMVLELESRPHEPFEVRVADEAGSLGHLRVDGARVTFFVAHRHTSNNLFSFFERQLNKLLEARGAADSINILHWKSIDDESMESYASLVRFARNLERLLGAGELWPKISLAADDVAELERRFAAICPALRNESFLPDWEYSAEHKLPIIPEPLALASLRRSENRADPVATMGLALIVVFAAVVILALLVVVPPWVPGE